MVPTAPAALPLGCCERIAVPTAPTVPCVALMVLPMPPGAVLAVLMVLLMELMVSGGGAGRLEPLAGLTGCARRGATEARSPAVGELGGEC